MKNSLRKGFTLVELLIVIVVIGILAAMMMLSSDEAVASARAAEIISGLRNIKTATLEWYADNIPYVEGKVGKDGTLGGAGFSKLADEFRFDPGDSVVGFAFMNAKKMQDIMGYLGGSGTGGYILTGSDCETETTHWYVWKEVTDSKVVEKLKIRSKTIGLCAATKVGNAPSGITSGDSFNLQTGEYVGMFIR